MCARGAYQKEDPFNPGRVYNQLLVLLNGVILRVGKVVNFESARRSRRR